MTEPDSRAPFAHYLDRMRALGFHPSRRLGQNFLLDPSLHRAVVDAAAAGPGDVVLEVGAGLGFLTRELVPRVARVLTVEIDDRLVEILRQEMVAWTGATVELLHGDALARGRLNPELADALLRQRVGLRPGGRQLLVANLPYAIAGPLLAELAVGATPPDGGAVLVQAEMAERVCAAPGSAAYGSLSVLLQSFYRPRLVRRVGAEVFRPRPRVDSAVFAFQRRGEGPALGLAPDQRAGFSRFLRQLFSQRRKTLRRALAAACRACGTPVPPLEPEVAALRPSALSADALARIWTDASRLP